METGRATGPSETRRTGNPGGARPGRAAAVWGGARPPDGGQTSGAPTADAELIRAIGSGSEEAFRLLFARWAPPLGRFLIRATGSREAGEDLLQEAFLRVLRAAATYLPDAPAGAWLYRICANLAYSYWRKERRRAGWLPSAAACGEPEAGGTAGARDGGRLVRGAVAPRWSNAAAESGPETARLRGLFRRDLDSALDELPVNQRMAFLLKAVQGMTYDAAAGVLGCPEGTVKSRFHHAVLRLRVALREWEGGLATDAPRSTRREGDHHGL